jgi:hypothetical protein
MTIYYTTQTLLSNVVYGQAAGNYDGSSQDWYSDAVPAANYYGGQGNLQTITYRVTGFTGRIVMEATLNDISGEASWFEIDTYDRSAEIITDYHPVNITGNFVWLRARVELFDAGEIQFVTAAY